MSEAKSEVQQDSNDSSPRSARSDYKDSRSDDFIEVSSNEVSQTVTSPASPLLKGMGLDLTFAARKEGDDAIDSERLQEGSVLVNFDLPDGSQGESVFKLGQTVEVLKSYVESEYGIPMESQTMYIENQPMMNPLSLLDFSETKNAEEIFIRVEGMMSDNSCKK